MGILNGRLQTDPSLKRYERQTKFCRLLLRDKVVSLWFKDFGKEQYYEIMTEMNEMVEKKEYSKDLIFNLHRCINPTTEQCERFIHHYKKAFGNSEECEIFFEHFRRSVADNYNTPWTKFCKKVMTKPLLWRRFSKCSRKSLMNMCIKMDLLSAGMVSEKEMKTLALKHHKFQISEQEFKEFCLMFVPQRNCKRYQKVHSNRYNNLQNHTSHRSLTRRTGPRSRNGQSEHLFTRSRHDRKPRFTRRPEVQSYPGKSQLKRQNSDRRLRSRRYNSFTLGY